MATKNLAKQLGLIRRSSVTSLSSKNPTRPKSKQFFDYLIIIDFESTCWRDTKHYGQEIIEFPAVLLNTTNGQVESEFHTYVQPQEHPILSEFCTELTGIKQDQVEEGVPLKICLSQFCSWIQRIQTEKKIMFISATSSDPSPEDKLCAFVTWSDWDLEVCLLYECKRKQLRKPDILNSWIDLRATYKDFYNRKPKGLNGALQDLGIAFSGREHSGLDDSRNTARLAWRMICDGCMMKITKSLDKVRPKMNLAVRSGNTSLIQSARVPNEKVAEASSKNAVCDVSCMGLRCDEDHSKVFTASSETRVVQSEVPVHGTSNSFKRVENDKPTADYCSIQNLLSPQTLIDGLSVSFGNRRSRISSCNSTMDVTSGLQIGNFSSTLTDHSSLGLGMVLVSTTISSMNSETDSDVSSSSECISMLADWEDVAVIEESEDVAIIQESEQEVNPQRVEQTATMQMRSLNSIASKSPNNIRVYKIFDNPSNTKGHASSPTTSSVVYKSPTTTVYNVGETNKRACSSFKLPELVSNHSNGTKRTSSAFKVSSPIEKDSAANHNKPTFKRSETIVNKSNPSTPVSNAVQKPKYSTLLPYFPKRKLSTTQFVSPPKKQPFTIYKDKELPNVSLPLTKAHSRTPSSSIFNSSIHTNQNQSSKSVGNGKITPPLCYCGRRSKRLTVSSMGPNQGRAFYCCPVGKRVEGKRKSCGYFKWDQMVVQEKFEKPPSPFISVGRSRENSLISSDRFSSSPKRTLCLRPSMRM